MTISSTIQAAAVKAIFFGGAAAVTAAIFGGVLLASGSLRDDVEKVLSAPEPEVIQVRPARPTPAPAPVATTGRLVARS